MWPRGASHAPRQATTRKHTALQATELVNPVKLLKVPDLGIHRARPSGTYFNSNYGRWAPLGTSKGNEATALSSKSIWLHLGHLNAVEKCWTLFFSVEFGEFLVILFVGFE
jgi:hypothetical protein